MKQEWEHVEPHGKMALWAIRNRHGNRVIAIVANEGVTAEQQRKDALLMADAPQLRAALQRLCDSFGMESKQIGEINGRPVMDAYRAALKALHEAEHGQLWFQAIGGPSDGAWLPALCPEPSESEIARPLEERKWHIFVEESQDVHVYVFDVDKRVWKHDQVIPEVAARVQCPDLYNGYI